WARASAELRKDPSVLIYYPFEREQTWSRTLRDQARRRKQPQDGVIVGCRWGDGRWPGKQALEFRRVSDRVRFHVPGDLESMTLAAWVRVDALPHRFNSLMMTDDWDHGAPHWHISNAGKIALGVQGPKGKRGYNYQTGRVFTPEKFGHW